jgi:hypothetical protein
VKNGDLFIITWEDSHGCPMGWVDINDCKNRKLAIIESVGWVSQIDKQAVTITPHIATIEGSPSCASGFVTIPLSGILKKQRLIKK